MIERPVSVVINTDNRVESLRLTLSSLTQLDYPCFEVVVVRGPTQDATGELLDEYAGRLKVGRCPDRNLSESRNIGIAMAAGDIVAFIDDDAYPDPAWLDRLVEAYDTPEIAAVGGPVWNWTGTELQARYCMANRFGDAWPVVDPSLFTPWLHNFPHTWEFPYTIGTNASFLRRRLIELGGFDEEFEYYLEETDLCSRLIDAGWIVKNIDDGFVYHKFLSSDIRSDNRATRSYSAVLKNKCYFAFKHALRLTSYYAVWQNLVDFAVLRRADVQGYIAGEYLTAGDLDQFDKDKEAAYDLGFERWQCHEVRTRPAEWFGQLAQPFVAFSTRRRRADKLHLCFFSQEYPPDPLNGIGRIVHQLATGLAGHGHVVHVLTGGSGHDRVDLEEGVWVHRVAVFPHSPPGGDVPRIPSRWWDYSASLLDELRRIQALRPVDVVHLPNWDSEGIAVLLDGHFETVVGLYTTLATMTELDPPMRRALADGDADLAAMLDLERWVYQHAPHLLASGPAILEEVESGYDIKLDPSHCGFVALGLHDEVGHVSEPLTGLSRVNVLFVGRLEARKGIDTLLDAIPPLLAQFPELAFTIIGEDSRPSEYDLTYRQRFEHSPAWAEVADRVWFRGRVTDTELRRHYAGCDIFVAPSRFESFGLVLLEAMMFAKPIVACDIGGMRYTVEDGVNGYLVPPGDSEALGKALGTLVSSDRLRAEFGNCSRRRYEQRYTVEAMVDATNRYYDELVGRHTVEVGSPTLPTQIPAQIEQTASSVTGSGHSIPPEPAPVRSGVGPTSPASQEAAPTLGPAGGLRLEYFCCPRCQGALHAVPQAVTLDGRLKTGWLVCPGAHGVVAVVEGFRADFSAVSDFAVSDFDVACRQDLIEEPVRQLPDLGELRIPASGHQVVRAGTWSVDQLRAHSSGVVGDALSVTQLFTDALVRLVRHPTGGLADLWLDDELVTSVDLFQSEGSQVVAVPVATDLASGRRQLAIRARGEANPASGGRDVIVEEIVLWGPKTQGDHFTDPVAINRGNPYSPNIEPWLATIPSGEPILECGGGDRRRIRPAYVNFELLKLELADVYGDLHAMPFPDDTFAATCSQAVFEHLSNPFAAAQELIRVTRPGGLVITEVAFMQPLHAVPYHYFNMTTWGVQELFKYCEVLECDWFGELSFTVDWLMKAAALPAKVPADRLANITSQFKSFDPLIAHEDLRSVASGVYLVARKPHHRE